MGGRKRREANPCTDGRGGGGGNGEDEVTRGLRGGPGMSYCTLLRLAGKGQRGRAEHGIWPRTRGVAKPPFGAVRRGAVCLYKLRRGERGSPCPLLLAEGAGGCLPWWRGRLGQSTAATGVPGLREAAAVGPLQPSSVLGRLPPLCCYPCPSSLKTNKEASSPASVTLCTGV